MQLVLCEGKFLEKACLEIEKNEKFCFSSYEKKQGT